MTVVILDHCPRCTEPMHEREAVNPLSRVDNKTRICEGCGTKEALYNHWYPERELPPTDRKVY